jgi:hypothetical protein
MINDDTLNGGSYGYLFVAIPSTSQVPIESGPAHLRQLAHSLDS